MNPSLDFRGVPDAGLRGQVVAAGKPGAFDHPLKLRPVPDDAGGLKVGKAHKSNLKIAALIGLNRLNKHLALSAIAQQLTSGYRASELLCKR